ncbi:MAG: cellulase family glycosylhydrolase [Fimbriimonadaceae bacterium]|nr:cellulase family glycosylhydrolase [Fimbriimonadaceae bacterium]
MLPLLLTVALLAPANRPVLVDQGVLRWADDRREVAACGVNYYPPFSIDHARLRELGLDHRTVIDQDLRHLQRLGLNLLRLHCFDREISDHQGNLLDNAQLALLDHLIAAAAARGIYTVLTPIAWWHVPDSPGFANLYTIQQMTGDPGAARAAQCRFLAQFVQHRNRETGRTYADDPAVLAFETINEPIYPPGTTDEQVVAYVNALVDAIRGTGCRKPVFHRYFAGRQAAVAQSRADGITWGWYPTGLVGGRQILENRLGLVNDFPAMRDPALAGKAQAVYEFDAADVPTGAMYPAMARALRSGGAQFAAQFQYDAWPLARTNVNWMTHFLSLPYAPGKALGFAIAAEAFRTLPRHQTYGATPQADRFGPFRVSWDDDLAELVSDTAYLHSHTTSTPAPQPAALTRLAGVGSNPLVSYDGTGAWFLDRLAPGCWQLEVYPDAVWVADPFGHSSLSREVARVLWRERALTVRLPDLSEQFTAEPVNAGNAHHPTVAAGRLTVRPGVYRLRRAGATAVPAGAVEYFAPAEDPALPPAVWHDAPEALVEGAAPVYRATVTDPQATAVLWSRTAAGWVDTPLGRSGPYQVSGPLPAAALRPPAARYALELCQGDRSTWFPGGLEAGPATREQQPTTVLWQAGDLTTAPSCEVHNAPGAKGVAELTGGALRLAVDRLDSTRDAVYAVRLPLRAAALQGPLALRLEARAAAPATSRVELGLQQSDGRAYGYDWPLTSDWTTLTVPLTALRPLWGTASGSLDPSRLQTLSVIFGTWLFKQAADQPHGVELRKLELLPLPPAWQTLVEPLGPPVPLLRPAALAKQRLLREASWLTALPTADGGELLELSCAAFDQPPDSVGVSAPLDSSPARRAAMGQCSALRLRLRALTPAARAVEVVLTESDGCSWGTEVPLTADWQTVTVPLAKLRYFRHWATIAGRGGADDAPRPAQFVQLRLTFGSWLNPAAAGQPWTWQIAAAELLP